MVVEGCLLSGSIWNPGFHKICGINPDQHFYIHLDKSIGFQHIDFTITSVATSIPYKFGLWMTQINCFEGSSLQAPGGCTQFHFGKGGVIKSFNFEGVQYLNNQNYKTCIRSEVEACFMELRADSNHFMLEPVEAEEMPTRTRMEERAQAVHEAMGMGLLFPALNRQTHKKYGRPNAKVRYKSINAKLRYKSIKVDNWIWLMCVSTSTLHNALLRQVTPTAPRTTS